MAPAAATVVGFFCGCEWASSSAGGAPDWARGTAAAGLCAGAGLGWRAAAPQSARRRVRELPTAWHPPRRPIASP